MIDCNLVRLMEGKLIVARLLQVIMERTQMIAHLVQLAMKEKLAVIHFNWDILRMYGIS